MSQNTMIRVLIIDDHDLLRRGLATALKPCADIQLVGAAANGAKGATLCKELEPDVVLVDLMMPEMDGITFIRLVRKEQPHIRIIVLTNYSDSDLVQSAIQAGATSYLLKNVSAEDLIGSIRNAYRGKGDLSQEAVKALVDETQIKNSYKLSKREQEVLRLIAKGYKNSQIADELIISEATAKKHVGNIITKLNVHSRTEAVIVAINNKLIKEYQP